MRSLSSNCLVINTDVKNRIADYIDNLYISPNSNVEEFILRANLFFFQLPENLQTALINFQRFGNENGGLLIKGLPEDPSLPATPLKLSNNINKHTFVSEFCCALFSTPLGEIYSYIQEKNGVLFQDLFPTEENKDKLSSESSEILLDFHTEVAFHPYLPDYLILYCLRSDYLKEAKTILACGKKIMNHLNNEEISVAEQTIFETGVDYSFGNIAAKAGGGRVIPILSGSRMDPFICFDPDLMKSTTEGEKIIKKINSIAHEVSDYVILEPGDLLLIDNRRAIHGRTQFKARFDGLDRWLQRVLIRKQLPFTGHDRNYNERIVRTKF